MVWSLVRQKDAMLDPGWGTRDDGNDDGDDDGTISK